MKKIIVFIVCCIPTTLPAQSQSNFVKENYTKMDTTITMRDGIKLYTVIYIPKDDPDGSGEKSLTLAEAKVYYGKLKKAE